MLTVTLTVTLTSPALAQSPITVVDRIGTNSVTTDNNPGGLIVHYDHGTAQEFWGTDGTVWTQPFNGTLSEVAFVCFARVVNATNGTYLDPVTNLSSFSMSLHLWTNGAVGFLGSTNGAHGDLIIPLGPGPSAPSPFGTTSLTNAVMSSTNLHLSTLPTFRLATNLAAMNLSLEAGREYVCALVFETGNTNAVIRQSMASTSGAPDVFATYSTSWGLSRGYTTNGFTRPQFATAISVVPTGGPTITAQPQGGVRSFGSGHTLEVGVSGTGPFSYQWRRDGGALLGATNPSLVLAGLGAGDAGWYSVVVSNASGVVTSSVVALSAVRLGVDMRHQAELSIYGPLPFAYRVDRAEALFPSTWLNLTNVTLTNNPGVVVDQDATNAPTRFYLVRPQ